MRRDQNETAKLVGELTKSFAAIEAEKGSSRHQGTLTAPGPLLKELQANVAMQSHVLEMK